MAQDNTERKKERGAHSQGDVRGHRLVGRGEWVAPRRARMWTVANHRYSRGGVDSPCDMEAKVGSDIVARRLVGQKPAKSVFRM